MSTPSARASYQLRVAQAVAIAAWTGVPWRVALAELEALRGDDERRWWTEGHARRAHEGGKSCALAGCATCAPPPTPKPPRTSPSWREGLALVELLPGTRTTAQLAAALRIAPEAARRVARACERLVWCTGSREGWTLTPRGRAHAMRVRAAVL